MSDNSKQSQGTKRFYDSNPIMATPGYQPVAKKKKGLHNSLLNFCSYKISY